MAKTTHDQGSDSGIDWTTTLLKPAPGEPSPKAWFGEEPAETGPPNPWSPTGLLDLAAALGRVTAGRWTPDVVQELDAELREKLAQSPMNLNAYGYDPWGFQTDVARRALLLSALVYRYYFRVQTRGIGNLPPGRMLLISNHAGQIAIDAVMIGVATVLEGEPPRIVRGMGEY